MLRIEGVKNKVIDENGMVGGLEVIADKGALGNRDRLLLLFHTLIVCTFWNLYPKIKLKKTFQRLVTNLFQCLRFFLLLLSRVNGICWGRGGGICWERGVASVGRKGWIWLYCYGKLLTCSRAGVGRTLALTKQT